MQKHQRRFRHQTVDMSFHLLHFLCQLFIQLQMSLDKGCSKRIYTITKQTWDVTHYDLIWLWGSPGTKEEKHRFATGSLNLQGFLLMLLDIFTPFSHHFHCPIHSAGGHSLEAETKISKWLCVHHNTEHIDGKFNVVGSLEAQGKMYKTCTCHD